MTAFRHKVQQFFEVTAWNHLHGITVGFSLFAIIFGTGFIFLLLFPEITLEIAIPLKYNIFSGIDLYGAWWRIFTLPALGIGILLVNLLIIHLVKSRDSVLPVFLYIATILAELFLLLGIIFIVLLNAKFYG